MKSLVGVAILAGMLALSGCQRGVEQRAQASAKPTATVDAQKKAAKEAHYCAGITKKGERCKRRVANEGDYCWMHADQDKRVK